MLDKPLKINDVPYRKIDGKIIIVLPEQRKIDVLDSVGSRIFELCNNKNSTRKIIDVISKEFNADEKIIEKDVINFINTLKKKGIINF